MAKSYFSNPDNDSLKLKVFESVHVDDNTAEIMAFFLSSENTKLCLMIRKNVSYSLYMPI